MIRRPPRSTLDRSSAASDVYKRQPEGFPMRVAYTTAAIGFFVFFLGWIIAAKLPDPKYGDHEAEDAADDPEDKKETVPLDDAVKEEASSGGENDKAGEDDKG